MTKRAEKKLQRAKIRAANPTNPNLNDDYCVDTALDKAIKYGTVYPKSDKNDYTAPMRDYKKKENK